MPHQGTSGAVPILQGVALEWYAEPLWGRRPGRTSPLLRTSQARPLKDISDCCTDTMLIQTHAGFGWLIGNASGGDRRLRGWAFLAAVLPDLDGISALFGQAAYDYHHHLWTHGLPFSLLMSAGACWHCRHQRLQAALLTQLAFYSHYFGDYFFTQYALGYLWPFSAKRFYNAEALWLGHPINYILAAVAVAYFVYVGIRHKRTPIEVISGRVDDRLVRMFFTRRTLSCHVCNRKCSEVCDGCHQPVCVFHGSLGKNCSVVCGRCREHVGGATKGVEP